MELQTISKFVPYLKRSDSTISLVTTEETSFTNFSSLPSIPIITKTAPKFDCIIQSIDANKEDSTRALTVQIVAALVVAGIGTLGTGLLLDTVQVWPVYQNVSEMFIMIPPLLGLKGNLEMTLASRLSTLSHLGVLNEPKNRWWNFGGNLALTQAQAISFAALASLVAVIFRSIRSRQLRFRNILLLCASGMVAASGAALLLGLLIVTVILVARRCRINPDNIATPLAASFGDLLTVGRENNHSLFIW